MGLADALLSVRAGDAVIVMDFGRVLREVEVTLQRAREVGAPVILLTDTLARELAERVDVALLSPRGRSGVLGSAVITLVVLDALLLGLANRDRARSLTALNSLKDLRAEILGFRIDDASSEIEDTPT
jgi:DNA-binding MurR/RpiR family transcriptional regulator